MTVQIVRSSSSSIVAAAAATAIAASSWYTRCQRSQTKNNNFPISGVEVEEEDEFRVEVHLMDKIQQKPYIQDAKEGIPSTLRILAIDLPEMRTQAFSGECRLSHDKVFVDDIAPPKVIIPVSSDGKIPISINSNDKKATKIKIAQKALVKSLVHCRSEKSQQRVGVELLEASVVDLNKYKLRKTHEFGGYKYDPGKYYDSKKSKTSLTKSKHNPKITNDDEIDEVDHAIDVELDKENFEDEIEAPWNQYAWAEELRLRINGHVPFGASLERSSHLQRYLFGHAYKVTVPAVSRFWEWPLPKFAKSDPDGIDGRGKTKCRAASKPHAVIANGAALQRVPSSLRLLQKLCRKADVPLFVIHDPRVWGGNTHQSLQEALREMRGTIKNRVISQALKQQGSSAFTRGRILGQLETEAKWRVKEKTKRAKELFTGDASERRKSDIDWSKLDSTSLEKKLVSRGVIQKNVEEDTKTYSVALVELARRCLDEEEKRKELQNATKTPMEEPKQITENISKVTA